MGPEMMGPTWMCQRDDDIDEDRKSYHQRAEVEREIQGIVCPTFVQEHNICNYSWLCSL